MNGAIRAPVEFTVMLGDNTLHVTDVHLHHGRLRAMIEGAPYDAGLRWHPGEAILYLDEKSGERAVQIERVHGGYRLSHGGIRITASARRPELAELAALMPKKAPPDTSKFLLCPMPGLVVSVNVNAGQEVKGGEVLAVVEAMKMENVLTAERDGTVKKINAKKGDSLALDDVILEFA